MQSIRNHSTRLSALVLALSMLLGGCTSIDQSAGSGSSSATLDIELATGGDSTTADSGGGEAQNGGDSVGESAESPASDTTNTDPDTNVPAPENANEYLSQMTLREKLCQMFIITPEALTGYGQVVQAGDATRSALAEYPVGGIIYFGQNLESVEQTQTMLMNCQIYAAESSGVGLFLAVDEEGGTVARCADYLGTTSVSSMESYGAAGDPQAAYQVGDTIGADLAMLGFNLDFAPVADVNLSASNELGDRIFSSDPAVVAEMTAQVVLGLDHNGICSTLKHFPGLGAGTGNTHHGSVYIDRTYDQLRQAEFVAFQGGIDAGADFVMVGHQITAASGDNLPGDLSPVVVTQWLKGDLGFTGLAVTDAQAMGAIADNYSSGQAAVMAVQAGIDVILMPSDFQSALSALEEAVQNGTITEDRINDSVSRILTKKEEMGLLRTSSEG